MFEDRPFCLDRKRRLDGRAMLLRIIEDLVVSLAVVRNDMGLLEDFQIQRIYASKEWGDLADLCPDVPEQDDVFKWDWDNIDYEKGRVPRIDKISLTAENLTAHLLIGIRYLLHLYNEKGYENSSVYDNIRELYDSQWFCQVGSPLLENPVLANECRKHYKALKKKRRQRSRKWKPPKHLQGDIALSL